MTDRRREILLVEDDEDHAELIGRAFEQPDADAQIVRARTLREAHERLADWPPQLVITDLRLPDGSGAELIEPLRESARYPVVVMTSFGDQQVAVEAMRTGALDYVVKSEQTFREMPRIAERAIREWSHIVERRRAEAALRHSEHHFRSLIENALDLILVLEPDGAVRYASPSIRRVLGWSPEAITGADGYQAVHADDRAAARRMLGEATAGAGVPQFGVLRFRAESGEWRALEVIGQASADGSVVINARDITERLRAEGSRRALEAQLRQSQKLETLGTLSGGIAHDFNNILQAILGCTELARGKVEEGSPARRYLDRSLEVGRRASDLVRQILQFSRQGDQQLAPCELRGLLAEVTRLLRATFPASIEIREALAETGAIVAADASQLHQVLINLANNARQALAGRTGMIEIGLERVAGLDPLVAAPDLVAGASYAVISVRDDGPGIPAEIRERIFEPFFTTKPVGSGTGLGLAVAHGIIKSHAGSIRVDSEPGRGATFFVFLPEGAPRPPERASTPAALEPPAPSTRVLLVDDDENVVYVASGLLERLGMHVVAAHSGVAALELFERDPQAIELAIVDEAMPRMTGSQLAAELRRRRTDLPVIIVSGHGLPAGALFDDRQPVRYLAKPFTAGDLAAAVGLALGSGRGAAGTR